jgi:uncharacterized secreted protein with C-terminal beta-propeller domain
MSVIGKAEGLAKGEDIRSVRFIGDTAYMVTYFQVDPLFVIDMSNPRAPRVAGELKIPGFSTYLHPAGGGLLIGFGRDVDEDTQRDAGLKISLFDATNPNAPRQADSMTLADGYSEVLYNPRALMSDGERGAYGYVYATWDQHTYFQVIAVKGGRLAVLATESVGGYNAYSCRLCYSGDTLYFVTGSGIKAYDYNDFRYLGEILFY